MPDVTSPAYGVPNRNGQKDVGADPTGASDSSAIFQNVVTVNEASGGGPILVPPGTYLLNTPLTGIVKSTFLVYAATFTGAGASSVGPQVNFSASGALVASSLTIPAPGGPYASVLKDGTTPTPNGVSTGKQWDSGGMVYNVKAYGAKGDGRVVQDGAITIGLAVFTSAGILAGDVGKQVCIAGAGTLQGGVNGGYKGIVLGVVAGVSATMDTAANASASGAWATIGHDDTAAIQAAINDAITAGGGTIYRPASAGFYLLNSWTQEDGSAAIYCLKVGSGTFDSNVSNIRLLSEGRAAALYVGPAGCVPQASTWFSQAILLNTNTSQYGAQALYPFNAVLRGANTVTMTTASDAGRWAVGDAIWLRSGADPDLAPNGEVNIVTGANAGTGVVNLRWSTSKPYAASGTYGASVVNSITARNLTLENEWLFCFIYAWCFNGIIGLKVLGGHVENTNPTPTNALMLTNNGFCRGITFRDLECVSNTNVILQWASSNIDIVQEGCRWESKVGTLVGCMLQVTENCANVLVRGCTLRTPGGIAGSWSTISTESAWAVIIDRNFIYMNAVTSPGGAAVGAITDDGTSHELEIRNNWISGPTTGCAILGASDGTIIEGNLVRTYGTFGIWARPTVSTNRIWILGNRITAVSPTNSMIQVGSINGHNHVVMGNLGIVESGGPGGSFITIPNDGAQTKSATVIGNFANGFTTGLSVASVANETGLYVAGNDFSGCTTAYNPTNPMGGVVAISVTASPFTYTASTTSREMVYVDGGTLTTIVKNAITLYSLGGAAAHVAVLLSHGEAVVVTYTGAPTMNKDRVA